MLCQGMGERPALRSLREGGLPISATHAAPSSAPEFRSKPEPKGGGADHQRVVALASAALTILSSAALSGTAPSRTPFTRIVGVPWPPIFRTSALSASTRGTVPDCARHASKADGSADTVGAAARTATALAATRLVERFPDSALAWFRLGEARSYRSLGSQPLPGRCGTWVGLRSAAGRTRIVWGLRTGRTDSIDAPVSWPTIQPTHSLIQVDDRHVLGFDQVSGRVLCLDLPARRITFIKSLPGALATVVRRKTALGYRGVQSRGKRWRVPVFGPRFSVLGSRFNAPRPARSPVRCGTAAAAAAHR